MSFPVSMWDRILLLLRRYHCVYLRGYKNIDKKVRRPDIFSEPYRNISWPHHTKAAFVLHLDDFCCKGFHNDVFDFGGFPKKGINKDLFDFLEMYPFVKGTAFTIPDPLFVGRGIRSSFSFQGRFSIIADEHRHWITWVCSRTFSKRIEIASHGLHHCQDDVKDFLVSREFEFKDRIASRDVIIRSEKLFSDAGIPIFGFKPSGWGIGHNSKFGIIDALKESSYLYACLSSPVSGLNWDIKRVSDLYPQLYEGILNIPQNITMNDSINNIVRLADRIVEAGGIIAPQLHYNKEDAWMSDGIGPRNLRKLGVLIDHLERNYPGKIWYATCYDIAAFHKT